MQGFYYWEKKRMDVKVEEVFAGCTTLQWRLRFAHGQMSQWRSMKDEKVCNLLEGDSGIHK